jgi:effector-binding domain-containing protein
MTYEINLEQRDPTLVLSKRVPVRISEIGGVLGRTFGELYGHLAAAAVDPSGPPFVIYHSQPGTDERWDVEICVPVSRAMGSPAGCTLREVPGGTVVRLLDRGPYETIAAAYDTLRSWVVEHRRDFSGPPREIYLSEPETPPNEIETIVEWPVSEENMPVGVSS